MSRGHSARTVTTASTRSATTISHTRIPLAAEPGQAHSASGRNQAIESREELVPSGISNNTK